MVFGNVNTKPSVMTNLLVKSALTLNVADNRYLGIIQQSRIERIQDPPLLVIVTHTSQEYYDLAGKHWKIIENQVSKNLPSVAEVHILCLDKPGEQLRCTVDRFLISDDR